jgi:hypothetical protein
VSDGRLFIDNAYNNYFGQDPQPFRKKKLTVTIGEFIITVNENTPIHITEHITAVGKLFIFYFGNMYINREHNFKLVSQQLQDLIATKILERVNTELSLVFCCPDDIQDRLVKMLKCVFKQHHFSLHLYSNNNHEYRGIHHVWRCAQENDDPSSVIFYMHSKGITRYNGLCMDWLYIFSYYSMICFWEYILKMLEHVPSINKVGSSCSEEGYIWHNIFFVRSSYVKELEEPIITDNRYYYEQWLGRRKKPGVEYSPSLPEYEMTSENYILSYSDCFSTISEDKYSFYNIGSFRYHNGTTVGEPFFLKKYNDNKVVVKD